MWFVEMAGKMPRDLRNDMKVCQEFRQLAMLYML